jgi:hypothetical protein
MGEESVGLNFSLREEGKERAFLFAYGEIATLPSVARKDGMEEAKQRRGLTFIIKGYSSGSS